jgi:thiamine biosynthesis protein ThiC
MRGQEEFMQDQRMINQQVADQINDLSMKIDLLTTQEKILEIQVTQLTTPPVRQQEISDSQKQVKEDVPKYVPPLRFPFPQRLVKPDLVQ